MRKLINYDNQQFCFLGFYFSRVFKVAFGQAATTNGYAFLLSMNTAKN
ncbi:MAG: hypothetical protein U5M23_12875 [Marinagarivorans sp.]|nr:hypothetical protein [Marinagarivorans sp.]